MIDSILEKQLGRKISVNEFFSYFLQILWIKNVLVFNFLFYYYKYFNIKPLVRKLEEAINRLFRFHSFSLRSVSPSLIVVSVHWFCLISVIILFTQCIWSILFFIISIVQYHVFLLVSRLYSVIFYSSSYYDSACVCLAIELVILIY